jgi:hypothetical protein
MPKSLRQWLADRGREGGDSPPPPPTSGPDVDAGTVHDGEADPPPPHIDRLGKEGADDGET